VPNVELRYAPDDALQEIEAWQRPTWSVASQGKGDLGQRLEAAFRDSFSEGAERVVIIGSDCPDILVTDVEEAWAELKTNDLVLGPARDGGYWLIGLRQAQPSLFQAIPWSTNTVFRETMQRAESLRLRTTILRQLADVDTEEDWREFLAKQSC
jgi:uncharacterized protein